MNKPKKIEKITSSDIEKTSEHLTIIGANTVIKTNELIDAINDIYQKLDTLEVNSKR